MNIALIIASFVGVFIAWYALLWFNDVRNYFTGEQDQNDQI